MKTRAEYPKSYHIAIGALIAGEVPGPMIRRMVARAIRDVRRTMGRDRAFRERAHMYYVGDIPTNRKGGR